MSLVQHLLGKSAVMPTAAAASAAPANTQARSAVTREARPRHARRVSTAIMLGRDLDVLVIFAPVPVPILDAQVGEVHLVIEVRQVVVVCPFADLFVGSIGVAIVVGAITIALMEPALVLALELVVEDDPFHAPAAVSQALCFAFVCAIDLEVVFPLPFAFKAVPERLAVALVAASMMFEEAPTFLRQRDGMLARAGHPNRFYEPLLSEMPQVT